jgi:hypothetical protein
MIKFLLLIVLCTAGCIWLDRSEKPVKEDTICIEPISDTVAKIPDTVIAVPAVSNCDSIVTQNALLQKHIDSLNNALFGAKYKIERVKYYLAIVNRKPSQVKFLRSWVTRAVK